MEKQVVIEPFIQISQKIAESRSRSQIKKHERAVKRAVDFSRKIIDINKNGGPREYVKDRELDPNKFTLGWLHESIIKLLDCYRYAQMTEENPHFMPKESWESRDLILSTLTWPNLLGGDGDYNDRVRRVGSLSTAPPTKTVAKVVFEHMKTENADDPVRFISSLLAEAGDLFPQEVSGKIRDGTIKEYGFRVGHTLSSEEINHVRTLLNVPPKLPNLE